MDPEEILLSQMDLYTFCKTCRSFGIDNHQPTYPVVVRRNGHWSYQSGKMETIHLNSLCYRRKCHTIAQKRDQDQCCKNVNFAD